MIVADTRALGLLTDLYQLTMAAGYYRQGIANRETVFHLFFRQNPFRGGYAVAAGLEQVVELLRRYAFTGDDVAYLAQQQGNDGKPLFAADFLDFLRHQELACDVDAMPEGTVVFPFEPLLRIRGPLLQCQILETALLTLLNFQTLIATKAARVCQAADGDAVLEFGLRRAQGLDGGVSASRAAYVGGCHATSNVLAGKLYGIPIKGTHAHSWVMSFPTEEEAFEAYAEALPNNCIFLVDTYDTIEGTRRAIAAARRLRERGHEAVGIRLDSGDLRQLSIDARAMLDEAGFPDVTIVASNDLDEHAIRDLKTGGARIDVWGVGTKLATAYDQPALGGVYKLGAYRDPGEDWTPVIKLSEERIKVSNPGAQQVRRTTAGGRFAGDVVFNTLDPEELAGGEDLLVPVFRAGASVYDVPPLDAVRERAAAQLASLPDSVRRVDEPSIYPVRLSPGLDALKAKLIAQLSGG